MLWCKHKGFHGLALAGSSAEEFEISVAVSECS